MPVSSPDAAPAGRFTRRARTRRMAAELLSGSERALLKGLLRGAPLERPVFAVGVPRSGTTSLFTLLRESSALDAALGESHAIWLLFHHPRFRSWESAAIEPGVRRPFERRAVEAYFASQIDPRRRLVDKTPANSLRLDHILELFPDARIVVMHRNPVDNINSLINGWRHPESKYGTFVVPQDLRIPDYRWRRLWCFALPPGWRSAVGRPLAEVCTLQWESISAAIERARERAPATSRWVDVHLERLVAEPAAVAAELAEAIEIPAEESFTRAVEHVSANPANALGAPRLGRWREENAKALTALLPRISALASPRGYRVDPQTGEFELL